MSDATTYHKRILVEIDVESHETIEWLTPAWIGEMLERDMSIATGPVFRCSVADRRERVDSVSADARFLAKALERVARAIAGGRHGRE